MSLLNRHFWKFFAGLVGIIALGFLAVYAPFWWQKYQVDKAISELQRPYREDVFGGKTPEETFDMFLGALKNGDLAGASKFFVLGKQEEYLEKFEKMRTEGGLERKISEWENARKEWIKIVDTYNNWKTRAAVRYKYEQSRRVEGRDVFGNPFVLEPGIYTTEITFYLNEASNVWKITLL